MPNHYRNRLETLNPASTMRSYPCGVAMMNRRWKITGVLAAVAVLCGFLLLRSDRNEQKALQDTRRQLRQQGFKIDFTAAVPRGAEYARRSTLLQNKPDLMATVGSNAALVVWKLDKLQSYSGEDLWPTLRETLNEIRAGLDAACESALSGPIRFDLKASAGNGMLLPHLPALKRLAQTLGARIVLELHDGNMDAAWTNLLASTRLVISW